MRPGSAVRLILLTTLMTGAVAACGCPEVRPDSGIGTPLGRRLDGASAELDRATRSVSHQNRAQAFLSAASRASALLFGPDPVDEDQRQMAQQIHNEALEGFLRTTGAGKQGLDDRWRDRMAERGLVLEVRRDAGVWSPEQFDRLEFADDQPTVSLRTRYRDEGVGVPMFSVRRRRPNETTRLQGSNRFLPDLQVYPVTAVVRSVDPDGTPVLELHDPVRFDRLESAEGGSLPLAKDLSAPLAFLFAKPRVPVVERVKSLDPSHLETSAGLHILQPYEAGKIPVVFIHGYWSDPSCWLQTINELRADPYLRSRYQFWTFIYPAMNPYLHSAALLRSSLQLARQAFDPGHSDPAMGRMVLVGHSMGGVLAKTMVQESGNRLWSLVSHQPLNEVAATPTERDLLEEVFMLRREPDVGRVVFIATPHRGSAYSNRLFGRIASRVTPHPGPLADVYKSLLRSNPPDVFTPVFREEGLSTSFDQLRIGDPVLEALDRIPIAPGVPTHSIIGQKHSGPIEGGSDGVVSYASSHVEGVESELVVSHHHFCQQEPETVSELKRILTIHDEAEPVPVPIPGLAEAASRGRSPSAAISRRGHPGRSPRS